MAQLLSAFSRLLCPVELTNEIFQNIILRADENIHYFSSLHSCSEPMRTQKIHCGKIIRNPATLPVSSITLHTKQVSLSVYIFNTHGAVTFECINFSIPACSIGSTRGSAGLLYILSRFSLNFYIFNTHGAITFKCIKFNIPAFSIGSTRGSAGCECAVNADCASEYCYENRCAADRVQGVVALDLSYPHIYQRVTSLIVATDGGKSYCDRQYLCSDGRKCEIRYDFTFSIV